MVLDKVQRLLHYNAFVFPGNSIKKDLSLQMSTRPIASYNLECELTRQELINSLMFTSNDGLHKIPLLLEYYKSYGLARLVMTAVLLLLAISFVCSVGVGEGFALVTIANAGASTVSFIFCV